MFGRRTRLTHDEAAQVLDNLDAPATRVGYNIRNAALMLAPSIGTTQSPTHRRRVKDVMLREFDRGDVPVKPQLEAEEVLPTHAPTIVRVDGLTARMADLDPIDDATAAAAAEQIAQIVAARARNRGR